MSSRTVRPVRVVIARSSNSLRGFMLSDTSDATAPVTVSGSSGCMSPNVDEYVHVRVSDSISSLESGECSPTNTLRA